MPQCTDPVSPAAAEVAEVWPRDGQILVRLEPTAAPGAERAALVLSLRGDSATARELPFERVGDRLEARIPLTALTAPAGTEPGRAAPGRTAPEQHPREWTWDLYLALGEDRGLLRLGRHLDDVQGKKRIFVYPAQHAAGVRVVPYYTIKDNLSVDCVRDGAIGGAGGGTAHGARKGTR
ncbi:hypothetical protein [Streptomyces sp. ODS28]|uniref:hypothetical protein n=1 Tax=Streptomyces sp. ODS28 TaxID=3136688 RepID=UPI0031E903AD